MNDIVVEVIAVLRPIRRFLLGYEKPDGMRSFRSKDARIEGRICDGEYLAKSIASVDLTNVKANRRSLSVSKDLHVEAKLFKLPSNRCVAAAEIRRG